MVIIYQRNGWRLNVTRHNTQVIKLLSSDGFKIFSFCAKLEKVHPTIYRLHDAPNLVSQNVQTLETI